MCKETKLNDTLFSIDIAVGAPYGGVGGRGAVYIFHGSLSGIRKDPAQVREI